MVQRAVTRHLPGQAGLAKGLMLWRRRHADPAFWFSGHAQHPAALPGSGRCVPVRADGAPTFVERAPTDDKLQAVLQTVIGRLKNLLTCWPIPRSND